MDSSTYLTPLPWNGLVPCYIYKASKGPNPSLQMEELQEAPVKSTAGMYCCKVCDKSISRKDNLSRHLLIHSEKKFQCHHCSKCYSQQGKLKIHQTRHHLDAKPISSKNSLVCTNCSKMFGRSFNFNYNMTVWHFGPCVTFWPCLCDISARLVWHFGPLVRNEGKRVSPYPHINHWRRL